MESLKDELEEVYECLDKEEQKNKLLIEENKSLNDCINKNKDNFFKEKCILENQILVFVEEIDNLKEINKIQTCNKAIVTKLKTDIKNLTTENELILHRLAENQLKTLDDEKQVLRQTLQELKNENISKANKILEYEQMISMLEKDRNHLIEKNLVLECDLANQIQQLSKLQLIVDNAGKQLKNVLDEHRVLKDSFVSMQSDMKKVISEHDHAMHTVAELKNENLETVAMFSSTNEVKDREIHNLSTQCQVLTESVDELNRTMTNIEAENVKLIDENSHLKLRQSDLQSKLKQEQQSLLEMQSQLKISQDAQQTLSNTVHCLKQDKQKSDTCLQDIVMQVNFENNDLKQQLSDMKLNVNAEKQNYGNTVQDLQSRLDEKSVQLNFAVNEQQILQEKLHYVEGEKLSTESCFQKQINELLQQIETLNINTLLLQNELQSKNENINILRNQKVLLKEKIEDLERSKTDVVELNSLQTEKLSTIKKDLDECRHEIRRLLAEESTCENLKLKLHGAQEANYEIVLASEDLYQELESLKRFVSEMESKLTSLTEQNNALINKEEELNFEILSLQNHLKENEVLKQQLADVTKETELRFAKYDTKIEELETALKKRQEELLKKQLEDEDTLDIVIVEKTELLEQLTDLTNKYKIRSEKDAQQIQDLEAKLRLNSEDFVKKQAAFNQTICSLTNQVACLTADSSTCKSDCENKLKTVTVEKDETIQKLEDNVAYLESKVKLDKKEFDDYRTSSEVSIKELQKDVAKFKIQCEEKDETCKDWEASYLQLNSEKDALRLLLQQTQDIIKEQNIEIKHLRDNIAKFKIQKVSDGKCSIGSAQKRKLGCEKENVHLGTSLESNPSVTLEDDFDPPDSPRFSASQLTDDMVVGETCSSPKLKKSKRLFQSDRKSSVPVDVDGQPCTQS